MAEVLELPDKTEWLAARTQGIGASDAPAVLGVSPWKSPMKLYAEKLGLDDPSFEESEAMRWGNRLEAIIAETYAEESGRALVDPGRFTIQRSAAHPFMLATLDRFVDDPARGRGVVEIKTANFFKADEWAEEPPVFYQVQLQHQLAVTGLAWGSLAVLIGGNRFLWFDCARNDAFIAVLIAREAAFWERVQTMAPPDPDATEATREALARLYPKDSGATVELPADADTWDAARAEAKEQLKHWEAKERDAENKIKAALGEATYGVLPGGGRFSWKVSPRAAYTVDPTTVRTLRRLQK